MYKVDRPHRLGRTDSVREDIVVLLVLLLLVGIMMTLLCVEGGYTSTVTRVRSPQFEAAAAEPQLPTQSDLTLVTLTVLVYPPG